MSTTPRIHPETATRRRALAAELQRAAAGLHDDPARLARALVREAWAMNRPAARQASADRRRALRNPRGVFGSS